MKLKNIKFSWTKWGRTQTGLEKREEDWTCQACADLQPLGIDPFLFKFAKNEYLRICANCQHVKVELHITNTYKLILACRKRTSWVDRVIE